MARNHFVRFEDQKELKRFIEEVKNNSGLCQKYDEMLNFSNMVIVFGVEDANLEALKTLAGSGAKFCDDIQFSPTVG